MKRNILLLAFAIGIISNACGQIRIEGNESSSNSKTIVQDKCLDEKKLRRDIAEMLMVGFRGTTGENIEGHIRRDITELHIGGILLFEYDAPTGRHKRNIESEAQVRDLCRTLQRMANGPLLIAIDQEGGSVSRLKSSYGFPKIPSAEQMAKNDSVAHYAQINANTLAKVGINVNFAPCVDLNTNPQCPVIGKLGRSFGSNAKEVTTCAENWITEHKNAGVISCLKHFPGHGSSKNDSHMGLTDVTDTWTADELLPYQTLIANGNVQMVMMSHIVNRNYSDEPASLSPTYYKILRHEMNFDGVIITDDIAMGAITKQYGYAEALRMAITAGADMICISNNGSSYDADIVPKTIEIILEFVKSEQISADQITKSASRIRKLKKELELYK